MDGLEQIISKIRADSEKADEAIISAAKNKADEILANGKIKAEKAAENKLEAAKKKCESDLENARSACRTDEKRAMLSARADAINGVISAAAEKLCSLPKSEYFSAMEKLIYKNAFSQNGELIFNRRDKERIPDNFLNQINSRLADKKGILTLSERTAEISGGFILSYGDIEQNCSVEALVCELTDRLKDELNARLFA